MNFFQFLEKWQSKFCFLSLKIKLLEDTWKYSLEK